MEMFNLFILAMFYGVVGIVTLMLEILMLFAAAVYTYKIARILKAVLTYAVTEPQSAIIKKVQKVNKIADKPKAKNGGK